MISAGLRHCCTAMFSQCCTMTCSGSFAMDIRIATGITYHYSTVCAWQPGIEMNETGWIMSVVLSAKKMCCDVSSKTVRSLSQSCASVQ